MFHKFQSFKDTVYNEFKKSQELEGVLKKCTRRWCFCLLFLYLCTFSNMELCIRILLERYLSYHKLYEKVLDEERTILQILWKN